MHGNNELSAYDYFKEADKIISEGYLIEDSSFEFRKDKSFELFLVAVVNNCINIFKYLSSVNITVLGLGLSPPPPPKSESVLSKKKLCVIQ
jgi:hypothetical protein